jgi:hypothetical protein
VETAGVGPAGHGDETLDVVSHSSAMTGDRHAIPKTEDATAHPDAQAAASRQEQYTRQGGAQHEAEQQHQGTGRILEAHR